MSWIYWLLLQALFLIHPNQLLTEVQLKILKNGFSFKTVILRSYILSASLLYFLSACSEKKQEIQLQSQEPKHNPAKDLNIYGKWTHSFPFYTSELTVWDNGTFSFFTQGCLGKSYSRGTWELYGADIICTSFDNYEEHKESIITTITEDPPFPKKKSVKWKKSKLKYEANFVMLKMSAGFNFPDTFNNYLNHERFRIKDDMLYKLNEFGVLDGQKFRRSSNSFELSALHFPSLPDSLKE